MMKKLLFLLSLLVITSSQNVLAHSGGHGPVSEVRAVEIASFTINQLIHFDAGLGFGKLDKNWNDISTDDKRIHRKGKGYYIVSATNKKENKMLKKLLLTAVLSMTVTHTALAYEWTVTASSTDGDTMYIDLDTIRQVNGFVYFWQMLDQVEPNKFGDLSATSYVKTDCGVLRAQNLTSNFYNQSMARGNTSSTHNKKGDWLHLPLDSLGGVTLSLACSLHSFKEGK